MGIVRKGEKSCIAYYLLADQPARLISVLYLRVVAWRLRHHFGAGIFLLYLYLEPEQQEPLEEYASIGAGCYHLYTNSSSGICFLQR